MNKEILMELEMERVEKLYSNDEWCHQQYVSTEWEYEIKECVELDAGGFGKIEFLPCGGWNYYSFEPEGELKEILEEIEIKRIEKLYSDDDWCHQQYNSNEWEYGLKKYLELEQQGLGVVEYLPWGEWTFRPLGEEPYDIYDEIHEEIEEEKWEEIFFTREEENMEEEEMTGIKLDKNTNRDWGTICEKIKEVENLPMDWEWEILDEHYNGNFTEYTVLIGEHIYEVSLFFHYDEETEEFTDGVVDYFYLKSLEEYQKEQEERENRIKYGRGGWEF